MPGGKIKYYPICDDCIKGKGQECHTPGCVYCFNDVPSETIFAELGIELEKNIIKKKIR